LTGLSAVCPLQGPTTGRALLYSPQMRPPTLLLERHVLVRINQRPLIVDCPLIARRIAVDIALGSCRKPTRSSSGGSITTCPRCARASRGRRRRSRAYVNGVPRVIERILRGSGRRITKRRSHRHRIG